MDPRTVILLAGVMSGLMAVVLFGLKRNLPASIKGLSEWTTALLVIFAGGVLVSAKGFLPNFVSISLSSALLWSGLYLGYVGTQRFFDIHPRPRRWIALIAAVLLVQVWFTLVNPSYHARLVLTTAITALLTGIHAYLVLKQGSFTYARMLVIWVLSFMSATQVMRLLTSFTSPLASNAEFFDKSVFQLVYVTSFAVCILLFSIGLVLMATERLRTELEHLVTHDALTSALTRSRMNEACERELERCRRHGHSMALLMMDLDHFKAINDTYGHQTGDRVLVGFVSKVKTLLRSADLLGRFGGEEFIAVLPETTLEEAIAVAERILQISPPSELAPSCTVSIGVTTNHKDSDTADTLLARADNAMYRAKARGRNRLETA